MAKLLVRRKLLFAAALLVAVVGVVGLLGSRVDVARVARLLTRARRAATRTKSWRAWGTKSLGSVVCTSIPNSGRLGRWLTRSIVMIEKGCTPSGG